MKIQLELVTNEALFKKFPNDPDYDFTIRCNDSEFKLQIAFLYLESKRFDEFDQKRNQDISLNEFDENALKSVLEVLYGNKTIIKTFAKLTKVYEVVNHLQIDSMKEMIVNQLQEQLKSLHPLEFLQFAQRNKILITQVYQLVLHNDMEVLRDPMSSMEMNKVSPKTLNLVLQEYSNISEDNKDQQMIKTIISSILSDYFHICKFKPEQYFEQNKSDKLKEIWFQTHPQFFAQTLYDSQQAQKASQAKILQLTEQVKLLQNQIERYDKRIVQLEQENKQLRQKYSQPNVIRFQDEDQPITISVTSPSKIKTQLPPHIPFRGSYQVPEQTTSVRRINHTSGAKFLQTVKDRNRNNSNAKGS